MKEHAKSHVDPGKKYACTQCTRKCNSAANLRAHVKEAHGPGYTAPCGDHFNWPPKYHRHLQKCKRCEPLLIEKKRQKYEYMSKAKHYFLHSV